MPSIKCAHCKRRHETVAAVKLCAHRATTATAARLDDQGNYHRVPIAQPEPTPNAAESAVATLPKVAARQSLETVLAVPEGRYALDCVDHIKFYKVEHGKSRWSGRTFVKHLVANGVHLAEYRMWGQQETQVLRRIAEDPQAASVRYGHELGQCGVCGRTLTDQLSRDLGIGPVCRAKRGW